jgi:hypothetical protein
VLISSDKRGKFDPVNEEGIMICYAAFSKTWKVLIDTPSGLVVRESQDAVSMRVAP